MKYIFLCLMALTLTSCKTTTSIKSLQEIENLSKQIKSNPADIVTIHKQVNQTKKAISEDVASVSTLFALLKEVVDRKWGEKNAQYPKNKKYVKYSNDYQARAIIDFESGIVFVETIATKNIKQVLAQATAMTLLTPADPRTTDIFSSKSPNIGKEPFLYQQVLDQDKKAIRYQWRANRFANYLVEYQFESRQSHEKTISSVSFPLVTQHTHLRKQKFNSFVLASAKKYRIDPSLIYGIIETESSFNPYAVSTANAYGLMQVVPATAGRDVYQKIKHKHGQPSKDVLFDPQQNIDIGSAYLSILFNQYLAKISNNTNQQYAVISGYNGGAGNVLRTFHQNRTQAFSVINNYSPAQLYHALTTRHPRAESRKYLEKVTKAKTKYQH